VAFYRFDLGFDSREWPVLRATGTELLGRLDDAFGRRGWQLYVFWPFEDEPAGYVLAEGRRADAQIEHALASAVGGSISGTHELAVELPDRPLLEVERFELVVVAAIRGPDKSCANCGASQPPHLDGCPRKHLTEPARSAAPTAYA
jgi:hypothetical protein